MTYSISGAEIRLFEIFKMLYPPKGAAKAEPLWGPIVLLILYFELLSTNVLRCFKNTNIIRLFEILKNLYPPKGAAKAEPVWGPIVLLILYFELLSTNVLGCFKNTIIIRLFEILKILFLWWVDGWVGCDLLPTSIFFIFKYDNKQNALTPKMCLKVASAF